MYVPNVIMTLAALMVFGTLILVTGNFETFLSGGQGYIHTADDHMITLRVANNFSQTGMPYFNESEPVSANTSLFWPIILGSTIMSLGPFASVVANVLLSAGLSAATVAISLIVLEDYRLRVVAAILMIFSTSFTTYAATGWEHVPQALFFTIGMALIYRASSRRLIIPNLAMLFVCMSFVFRPDSAAIIFISGLIWFFHNENFKKRQTYAWCVLFLIIPGSYLLLMEFFYGNFFPNTAHLKKLDLWHGLSLGAEYVLNPVRSGIVPLLLLLMLILRPKFIFGRFVLLLGSVHFCYVVYIGGDVFGAGRFFFMLMPIVVVTTLKELAALKIISTSHRLYPMLYSAVLIFLLSSNYRTILQYTFLGFRDENMSAVEEQVRLLDFASSRLGEQDGSIGLHYLGVAYHFPDYHVVDFLGKAEPFIANTEVQFGPIGHNRWDYSYAFSNYDISIVPIQDVVIDSVTAPDFELSDRNYVFWDVCALFALQSGNYRYIPAQYFGNRTFGALVRIDLLERFGV